MSRWQKERWVSLPPTGRRITTTGRSCAVSVVRQDELVALSAAVAQHGGTTLEFIPSSSRQFTDGDVEVMAAMSRAAGKR